MAKTIESSRRGHGRHGLDRQHHGARADQSGAHGGRARARRRPQPREDFALPRIRDELKYRLRFELMLDTATETHHACATVRSRPRCRCGAGTRSRSATAWAAPARIGTASPGAICRANSYCEAICEKRYGKNAIPADMTIQDWGVTYDELEPYYERFEKLCGTSGKAGNLRGQIDRRRQSLRRAARQRLSQQAADHVAGRPDLHQSRKEPRLSSVPDAVLAIPARPIPIPRA